MGAEGARPPLRAQALIGRDHENEALHDAWGAGGATRIVRGPAGIGKSRLIRELGSWAAARGGVVLVGRATPTASTTPFRPVREALLTAARHGLRPPDSLGPLLPALAGLVPDWAHPDRADDVGHGSAHSSVLVGEAVLRLLAAFGSVEHPATLVVEDLQWADPETLATAEFVADHCAGLPVLLVATVRDGEPGPGTDLANELVRRRVADEIVLRQLTDDEVLDVAASCLGSDVPADVADVLTSRSDGVPFLVEELVAAAVSSGWDAVRAGVPGSVVASVELRLERLEDQARSVLSAAALLGRRFDWTVAAAAAQVGEDAAAAHLRSATRLQLIDADGASFAFHHALTRDAVLATVSPAELDLYAQRAFDLLTADGSARLDGDRRLAAADLAVRIARSEDAAHLYLDAARAALAAGAVASAERFAGRADEMGSDEVGLEVSRVLLESAVLTGDTDLATQRGERLLTHVDEPAARADVHLLLGTADLAAGRWSPARERAERAAGVDPTDTGRRARANVLAAQAAMGLDDVDTAAALARTALDDGAAAGLATVQCEALEVLGRIDRGRDLAAAEASFRRAHDIAESAGLSLWRIRALQELGTIDLFDSLDLSNLREARRQASALGTLATVAMVDLQLSAVHDERAEMQAAFDAAARCIEVSQRLKLSTLAMAHVAQAKVHARRGDGAAMAEAVARARATGEDADYVELGVVGNVEPIFHIVRGDLPAAVAALDQAMEASRLRPGATLPHPGLWALLRTILDDGADEARAEVGALAYDTTTSRRALLAAEAVAAGRAGDRADAEARFGEADDALRRQGGGHLRHGLVRLLVAPAAHRDGWGEPEAWLRETAAHFDQIDLPALAARCRHELGRMGAAVPRRSGRALADTVPPSLAKLGITPRESDVLALVAGGATNREIADELFISVRTVDKHVERLLQKTGVTRAGLATVADEAGLLRT